MLDRLVTKFCCCHRQAAEDDDNHGDAKESAARLKSLPAGSCHFIELPTEIKRRIVSYLPTKSALRLSQTSHRVRSDFCLVTRPAFRILQASSWRTDMDIPHVATVIPVFDGKNTHSVALQCQWYDQNVLLMSKLYIVGHPEDSEDLEMTTGVIVAESGYAMNAPTTLTMVFRPVSGTVYYLWYYVGGGAASELFLSDVHVRSIAYVDPQ